MKNLLFGILVCCTLLVNTASAQQSDLLRDDHPEIYTVRKGDTLWDISSRFLNDPWLWPEIWQVNEQIENPHLIYPGDRISLVYIDGRPALRLTRSDTVYLGPSVRSTSIDEAISAIPLDDINVFLSRSRILDPNQFEDAAYVLAGAGGHVITGAGDSVFGRGQFPAGERVFGMYRKGQLFVDPGTGEVLGLEAIEVGQAKLRALEGDVGTLLIDSSNFEVRVKDRLLPYVEQRINANFFPSAPESNVEGVIMAVEGGVTQVARLDIVMINRGTRDGLDNGNVLAIFRRGETVPDPLTRKPVQLPDARAGLLMVFRSFEKMSYGLVLESSMPLKVLDKVKRP